MRIEGSSATRGDLRIKPLDRSAARSSGVSSPTSPKAKLSSARSQAKPSALSPSSPKSPADKARDFFQTVDEGNIDEAFARIQLEGARNMRRGSLAELQSSVYEVRRSQRDVLKSLRDIRRASEDVDASLDNSLRRFTIAQNVVSRMKDRSYRAQTTTFVVGSDEHKNWERLRQHSLAVADHARKNKLQEDVTRTKEVLSMLGANIVRRASLS